MYFLFHRFFFLECIFLSVFPVNPIQANQDSVKQRTCEKNQLVNETMRGCLQTLLYLLHYSGYVVSQTTEIFRYVKIIYVKIINFARE